MMHFLHKLIPWAVLALTCAPALAQNNNTACVPAMRYGSILNNVHITSEGYLVLGNMYATCLPQPARQSSFHFSYNPDSTLQQIEDIDNAWYLKRKSVVAP